MKEENLKGIKLLISTLKNGNISEIRTVLYQNSFKDILKEEINDLLDHYDYSKISKEKSEVSLPLLEKLANTGNEKAKKIFSEKINKIIDQSDTFEISNLIKMGYFSIFNTVERKAIFRRINFNEILNSELFSYLTLLRKLSFLGSTKARKILKEEIKKLFLDKKNPSIFFVLNNGYFYLFTPKERNELFSKVDLDLWSAGRPDRKKGALNKMTKQGCTLAKEPLAEMVIEIFSSENVDYIINLMFKYHSVSYLNLQKLFNKQELENLFCKIDFAPLNFEVKRGIAQLSVPLAIEEFRKMLLKATIKAEIGTFKKKIQDDLESGIYDVFFPWFKEKYKPWEDEYYSFREILSYCIINQDLEDIFSFLNRSELFKNNFRKALNEKYPFSIPFKTIALFADNSIKEAQKFLKSEIIHFFNNGPLRIIGFLSRPRYIKFLNHEDIKEHFSVSNIFLKNSILQALITGSSIPLALGILKRIATKGDMEAFKLLKFEVEKLYGKNTGMKSFLENDGFIQFIHFLKSKEKRDILHLISNNKNISETQLVNDLSIERYIVLRNLRELKEEKLVSQKYYDNNQTSYYKINQKRIEIRALKNLIEIHRKFQNEKKRIIFLTKEIERHRYLYYNEQPEVSDAKYDTLEDELRSLDPDNQLLFKIGVNSSTLFTKRKHIIPMTSQDKVTTDADFKKWAKKRNYKKFLVQFKLDGISIELQYNKGIFQYAITRGDGEIGDDVSANVVKMKGFLSKLNESFTGAVRAEILLFHDIYDKKYNDKQNCRNAAAGLVRRKDGIGSGDLNLIFYDAISTTDEVTFQNEIQKLKWLKEQNFPTILTKTVKTPQEVIQVRENTMNKIRSTLDYDIDGLVVKGKEVDLEDMKRAKPTKQIAFKFQA